MIVTLISIIVALPFLALSFAWLRINARGLTYLDAPTPALTHPDSHSQSVRNAIIALQTESFPHDPDSKPIESIRAQLERYGEGEYEVDFKDVIINKLTAEWVTAPGYHPDRRILFIHGGAFSAGSAHSHRKITSHLARQTGAAVLAINYRLMPENRHQDLLFDCQSAYHWILEHGPDGPAELASLAVVGDSAGGNLTLVIAAWARDQGLRRADALVAFAPSTDSALASPSMRNNLSTDPVLAPVMNAAMKLPTPVLYLINWWLFRKQPCSPQLSPLRGNLADLPPTLIQVSKSEILYDESVRYTNKARAAGSDITLETWADMPHVFQLFAYESPEAQTALESTSTFLRSHLKQF